MRIVIDAGHYTGYNQSPVYPDYREGNMTWKLYLKLKAELIKRGYTTIIGTRGNQSKEVEVYQRGQTASNADLLISLHSNACGTETVRRVVVIPPIIDTYDTYDLANRLGKAVSDCMGIQENYQIYPRPYTNSAGKTVDHYGLIRGAVEAGCRRSLIIEHGFHTNKKTAEWLNDDGNLQKLAEVEANVIAEFLAGRTSDKKDYHVGDKYTVKDTDKYSNGYPVAKFAIGRTYEIGRVLRDRILLKEINSWVVV